MSNLFTCGSTKGRKGENFLGNFSKKSLLGLTVLFCDFASSLTKLGKYSMNQGSSRHCLVSGVIKALFCCSCMARSKFEASSNKETSQVKYCTARSCTALKASLYDLLKIQDNFCDLVALVKKCSLRGLVELDSTWENWKKVVPMFSVEKNQEGMFWVGLKFSG